MHGKAITAVSLHMVKLEYNITLIKAGKSYSMVGYGPNRGIVPITCEEIFKRIESNKDPNKCI